MSKLGTRKLGTVPLGGWVHDAPAVSEGDATGAARRQGTRTGSNASDTQTSTSQHDP